MMMVAYVVSVYLCKQKSAYEMRISDWSSDVCSSDLHRAGGDVHDAPEAALHHAVDGRLDELDRRQHVGVQRLDPVVAAPVAEVARRRAAGVVDEDVRLRAGLQRQAPPLRRGDVGRNRVDSHAGGGADLFGGLQIGRAHGRTPVTNAKR